MVNYGHACKILESTPTDLITVQPFKVVLTANGLTDYSTPCACMQGKSVLLAQL